MTLRARLFTALLNTTRLISRAFGCELAIETSSHSLKTKIVVPDKDRRAWDSHMYKFGNLFHTGYANPIKPVIDSNPELEKPDEISLEQSDTAAAEGNDTEDVQDDSNSPHVTLISSARYRSYMRQDLISQLLTPREQWRILAYGILALGFLQLFSLIIILFTNGTF